MGARRVKDRVIPRPVRSSTKRGGSKIELVIQKYGSPVEFLSGGLTEF